MESGPLTDRLRDCTSAIGIQAVALSEGCDAFVEVQGTAEGKPFSRSAMDGLIDLARAGILELFAKQRAALEAQA